MTDARPIGKIHIAICVIGVHLRPPNLRPSTAGRGFAVFFLVVATSLLTLGMLTFVIATGASLLTSGTAALLATRSRR